MVLKRWMEVPMSASNTVVKREEGVRQSIKGRPVVSPLVDIFENKDEYLVVADLPGVSSDKLTVRLDQGELTLEGQWVEDEKGSVVAREFRPMDFRRTFLVPDSVDAEKIAANLANGVLKVRLPKAEAVKPRRIEIQVG